MLTSPLVPKLAFDALKEIARSHSQPQKFSDETLLRLHSLFGATVSAAAELLETCKITQYRTPDGTRIFYKVGPPSDRYTVYDDLNFCQCKDFRTHVLERRDELTCKHVLGLHLNRLTGAVQVRTETVTDSQFVDFLNEQLNE